VPYKEPKIEKIYYRIGEVADMLGLNPSNIRFWELESGLIKPKKTGKGNRLYTLKEIEQLRLILHLTKDHGLTLKGVKNKLRLNPEGTSENFEIIRHLQNIRQQLVEIREQIDEVR
jgi:DNA-binding transcriptional MerR regulator